MPMRSSRPMCAVAALGIAASAGLAAPCPADHDGSGWGDVNDLLGFLGDFRAGSLAADYIDDGAIDVSDLLEYLRLFRIGCADDTDTDGDGLRDIVETGTGVYRGRGDTGTDPFVADTDGDGLPDGEEVLPTADGLNLRAFGVSPLRRDILVEIDWFGNQNGHQPSLQPLPQTIMMIEQVFAAAPLTNPDGSTGISIRIDYGQGGAFTGGNQLPGAPDYITFPAQFQTFKADHFDPRRYGRFHYCIFAMKYNAPDNGSSGIAELSGDDFMVTLGNVVGFTPYPTAATFVHELGHNLGLRHGGFENLNNKPNYNSVMNYRHQFNGIDVNLDGRGDGVIDYSIGALPPLDESSLIEAHGIGGPGSPAIDWNGNGVIDPAPYARNLNCTPGGSAPCGVSVSSCTDSACTVLHDQNDWASINWNRLPTPGRFRLPEPPAEIEVCPDVPRNLRDIAAAVEAPHPPLRNRR